MAHRQISELLWARRALEGGPFRAPRGLKGAKAAGLRYERRLAEVCPGAAHGPWFEFQDKRGRGWCQPDVMFEGTHSVLVLEAKYTWTEVGHTQIEQLYVPVLTRAIGKPTFGVQVCKNLAGRSAGIVVVTDIRSAIAVAKSGRRVVWHWMGGSVVGTPSDPAIRTAA